MSAAPENSQHRAAWICRCPSQRTLRRGSGCALPSPHARAATRRRAIRHRNRLIIAHEDIALDRLLDRPQQDAAINRLARRLDGPVLIERGYGLLIFVVATRLGDDLVELADTDPDRLCR